jgi:hypothetical protein
MSVALKSESSSFLTGQPIVVPTITHTPASLAAFIMRKIKPNTTIGLCVTEMVGQGHFDEAFYAIPFLKGSSSQCQW